MHVITWTSGHACYATPTRQVVEVIPVVQTRPISQAEPYVVGLINYRGQLLQLVDAACLLRHESPHFRQYARILIVEAEGVQDAPALCGLLVDSVIGGEQLDFDNAGASTAPITSNQLGPVAIFGRRTIQLIDTQALPICLQNVQPT